jgi:hypothetical protein
MKKLNPETLMQELFVLMRRACNDKIPVYDVMAQVMAAAKHMELVYMQVTFKDLHQEFVEQMVAARCSKPKNKVKFGPKAHALKEKKALDTELGYLQDDLIDYETRGYTNKDLEVKQTKIKIRSIKKRLLEIKDILFKVGD